MKVVWLKARSISWKQRVSLTKPLLTSRAQACANVSGGETGAWAGVSSPARPPRGAGCVVACPLRTEVTWLRLVDGLRQGLSPGEKVGTPRERKQANS